MNYYVAEYWRIELDYLGDACRGMLLGSLALWEIAEYRHAMKLEERAIGYAIRAAHAARQIHPRFVEPLTASVDADAAASGA